MTKDELLQELYEDVMKSRGSLREIISHNRMLNHDLVEQMKNSDYQFLEEYNLLTKNILDSVKTLTEVNATIPKVIDQIDKIQDKKEGINLDDFID